MLFAQKFADKKEEKKTLRRDTLILKERKKKGITIEIEKTTLFSLTLGKFSV